MTQETSSPEVIPALTKTDAKELKSLVRRDTQILQTELDTRSGEYERQLNANLRAVIDEINEEREERAEQDQIVADKAMKAIVRKVGKLNDEIIAHMTEMADAGWSTGGRWSSTTLDPHAYTISVPSFRDLRPPKRSDEDLNERQTEAESERDEAMRSLNNDYRNAKRYLEVEEARMLRELTLNSITTEAAREFILEMPDVDDLLPAPAQLEVLEG